MREELFATSFGHVAAWVREGELPCVFLHGLGCGRSHFQYAFEDVSGRGRGVIALDLPGCGQSSRLPENESYSGLTQAAAVRSALALSGNKKMILVFHSLATLLLPWLLRDLGEEIVVGVILIEGNILAEDANWSSMIAGLDQAAYGRYFRSLQRGGKFVLQSMLKKRLPEADFFRFAATFSETDQRAFRETATYGHAATVKGEALAAMAAYRGLKLYLRGEQSDPWGGHEALRRSGAAFMTISGAGHFPHIENPIETYEAVFGLGRQEGTSPC